MLLLHPLNLASSLLLHPLNKPSSLFILFNFGQATMDLTVNLGATWVPLFGGLFQPIWSSYEVGLLRESQGLFQDSKEKIILNSTADPLAVLHRRQSVLCL